MTQQLIAVDANALDRLMQEVSELRDEIRQARIAPEPQWITEKECATKVGKSLDTVRRWIREGKLERNPAGLVRNPEY